MAKKNELAIMNEFAIAAPYEGMTEEEIAELNDELGDLDPERSIICKAIKIPNGSSNAFSVESEDDPEDSDPVKTFEGVIVFTHKVNAYWESAFGGGDDAGGNAPTCSAIDGKTGVVYETGEKRECEYCPFNQFGPDGSGKACKNMRRMYILLSGRPSVYLLTLPPTSIKDVNRQLASLMTTKKVPYTRMVMRFSLKKAESRGGIAYNKVALERAGILPQELWTVTSGMHKELKDQYTSFAVADDEYLPAGAAQASAPATGPDGFVAVEGGIEEELPFT